MHKFKHSLNIPIPVWATHSLVFTSENPTYPGLNAVYIGKNAYQYYAGVAEFILDTEIQWADISWDSERWVDAVKDSGPYALTDLRAVEENE